MTETTPSPDPADAVCEAILRALGTDPRTAEPMNALVAWTEVGRGLCATLEARGAGGGLVLQIVDRWCDEGSAAAVDFRALRYPLPEEGRLRPAEIGEAVARVALEIREHLEPATDGDGERAAFLTVLRGWLPAGLAILGNFPAGQGASPEALLGALRSWCRRWLPGDGAGEGVSP